MEKVKTKRFIVATAVLVFLVTFGLGLLVGRCIITGDISDAINHGLGKSYNILVMGIDVQQAEANSRSDTMILVSIDKKSQDIAMVWIPRDTRVEVGKDRYAKINSINYLDGPEAAARAVSDLLDLKVNYYVTTDFGGFVKIIDILGGVHIDVPADMYHYDPDPVLAIQLSKGPQVLNGQDALRFVRYRDRPTADIGRTGRQQQFIKALAEEMFSTKTILKLPQLVPEIIKHVHTNIPMKDMLYLADVAREFEQGKIITQTLPGYPYTEPRTGASYWIADEDIAQGIVKDLLAGKEFAVAQDPPQAYTRVKTDAVGEAEAASEELVEEEAMTGDGEEENIDRQDEELTSPGEDGNIEPQEDELTEGENETASPEPGLLPEDVEAEPEIIINDSRELPEDLTDDTLPVTVQ